MLDASRSADSIGKAGTVFRLHEQGARTYTELFDSENHWVNENIDSAHPKQSCTESLHYLLNRFTGHFILICVPQKTVACPPILSVTFFLEGFCCT
jgi:hypothetical protein